MSNYTEDDGRLGWAHRSRKEAQNKYDDLTVEVKAIGRQLREVGDHLEKTPSYNFYKPLSYPPMEEVLSMVAQLRDLKAEIQGYNEILGD